MTEITCPHGKPALSPETAKGIAKRVRGKGDSVVQAYKCRECGNWHVGLKSKQRNIDKTKKK